MKTNITHKVKYEECANFLISQLDENNEVQLAHQELREILRLERSSIVRIVRQLRHSDDWEVISGGWRKGQDFPTSTTYRYLGNN